MEELELVCNQFSRSLSSSACPVIHSFGICKFFYLLKFVPQSKLPGLLGPSQTQQDRVCAQWGKFHLSGSAPIPVPFGSLFSTMFLAVPRLCWWFHCSKLAPTQCWRAVESGRRGAPYRGNVCRRRRSSMSYRAVCCEFDVNESTFHKYQV